MLISPDAIRHYLARPMRSLSVIKDCKEDKIKELLDKFPVEHKFTSADAPWLHQLQSYYVSLCVDGVIIIMPPGNGKTRICFDSFAYRRKEGEAKKMLVITVNEVNVYNWLEDAEAHRPDVKAVGLLGSGEKKWEARNSEADCYVVSYGNLAGLLEASNVKGKKKAPNRKKAEILMKDVDFIVFDEIHLCKNWKTLNYQCSNLLSSLAKYRVGATGTIFGRDVEALFTQFFLVDRGETFGTTLGLFRASLFNEKIAWGGWRSYAFREDMRPKLSQMMDNRSVFYSEADLEGMPIPRPKIVRLSTTPVQREYLMSIRKAYVEAKLKGEKAIQATFLRQRTIASGFIMLKQEDSERIEVEFDDNPRLDAFKTFCTELPPDKQAIIVHEFVYSGKMLRRELDKMKLTYGSLHGSQKREQRKKELYEFKAGNLQYMVMNWKSGGTGLNFPLANYMFFFESPVSPISRTQTKGRIRRRNSKYRRAYYTDVVLKNSVDERIQEFLEQGKDLYRALLEKPGLMFGADND